MSGPVSLGLLAALEVGFLRRRQRVCPPERFTADFAAALRAHLPEWPMEITGPLRLQLEVPDGPSVSVSLDNPYADCGSSLEALPERAARFAASLSEHHAPTTSEQIVPLVRDRGILELEREGPAGEGMALVWEELCRELLIVYAVDGPTSMRYLTSDDLERLNLDRASLRELAVANLSRLLEGVGAHLLGPVKGLDCGGDYEASLLLLDGVWRAEQLRIEGDPVVAVPNRDMLLVAGSDEPDAVAHLARLAHERYRAGSYPISPLLFIRRDGRWRRYDPATPGQPR